MWMHVCTVYVAKGLRVAVCDDVRQKLQREKTQSEKDAATHKNLGRKKKQSEQFCSSVVLYKYFSGRQINILSAVTTVQNMQTKERGIEAELSLCCPLLLWNYKRRWEETNPIFNMKTLPIKSYCWLFLSFFPSFFFFFDRSGIDIWQICILTERKINSDRNKAFFLSPTYPLTLQLFCTSFQPLPHSPVLSPPPPHTPPTIFLLLLWLRRRSGRPAHQRERESSVSGSF